MTGPETPSSAGGSGGPPGRQPIAVGRAVVLLVVAVVAGVLLLHVATEPAATTATPTTTTTTTTTPAAKTTTTTTTKPNPAIQVLVANGTTTIGAATYFTTKLKGDGWSTLSPVTAPAPVKASNVYYAAGEQKSAEAVAKDLGLSTGSVAALTSTVAVTGATQASVVVVVGPDLAGQVPATTTTT